MNEDWDMFEFRNAKNNEIRSLTHRIKKLRLVLEAVNIGYYIDGEHGLFLARKAVKALTEDDQLAGASDE